MNIIPTPHSRRVKILEPKVFGDERGFFMETFRDEWFRAIIAPHTFVQENHSKSASGVLRGLHYQTEHTRQLVRVVAGAVFDVADGCAANRHRRSNGQAPCSRRPTSTNCGCPKALPTAFMCWATAQNSYTNALIITTPNPSKACCGTMPPSPSTGRSPASRNCQPKIWRANL